MGDVWVAATGLHVHLSVPERVISLRTEDVVVPLESVTGVRVVRDALAHLRGTRQGGSTRLGLFAVGLWRGAEQGRLFTDFVVVHRPGPGIVVTTDGEFSRLVLGTEEPEELALQLGPATACDDRPPSG